MFGVRRHIIDDPFGVLDPELGVGGGIPGLCLRTGGALFGILVLDRSLWDLSRVSLLQGGRGEILFYHDFYR